MAGRYENSFFLWSWHGEMVGGEPVLSDIRKLKGTTILSFINADSSSITTSMHMYFDFFLFSFFV